LTLLSRNGVWESLPGHGGGRRLTVEGLTVGAFHLFGTEDELDPRPNALVVHAVDIWPDGFPDDPTKRNRARSTYGCRKLGRGG